MLRRSISPEVQHHRSIGPRLFNDLRLFIDPRPDTAHQSGGITLILEVPDRRAIVRQFKSSHLAAKQTGGHVVPFALLHTLFQRLPRYRQMHEQQRDTGVFAQYLPVGFTQGRTRQDDAPVLQSHLPGSTSQSYQPGQAVSIVERDAAGHLGNIFYGMNCISFKKGTSDRPCKLIANSRLSAAADAHHDNGKGRRQAGCGGLRVRRYHFRLS